MTGRRVAKLRAMGDFTIILTGLTDMTSCDLKVYDGLDRLWRMVERYKMTAPITITVVDKTARQVRGLSPGTLISRPLLWRLSYIAG